MQGQATFMIKDSVAIGVTFDVADTDTRADIEDLAWSALVDFVHRNHEVAYSFGAKKAASVPPTTESESD